MKALERDPGDRYPDVAAFARALQGSEAAAWRRRSAATWLTAGVLGLGLLTGLAPIWKADGDARVRAAPEHADRTAGPSVKTPPVRPSFARARPPELRAEPPTLRDENLSAVSSAPQSAGEEGEGDHERHEPAPLRHQTAPPRGQVDLRRRPQHHAAAPAPADRMPRAHRSPTELTADDFMGNVRSDAALSAPRPASRPELGLGRDQF
jgi:hypothetical protein